tara:strand:+ start:1151 stop:1396 length:246 start_codon:yes stop_codon:yes gene_type:complete
MTKNSEKEKNKLMFNDIEYSFYSEDLSEDARASYARANQLALELMQLERSASEKRFVINNYVQRVVDDLEENKNVDEKEKK